MPNQEFALELTQHAIVLMGISFMLGSLCTIFILLILDMVRAGRAANAEMMEAQALEQAEADRDAA